MEFNVVRSSEPSSVVVLVVGTAPPCWRTLRGLPNTWLRMRMVGRVKADAGNRSDVFATTGPPGKRTTCLGFRRRRSIRVDVTIGS